MENARHKREESIESIFTKIFDSFNDPVFVEKDGSWAWNNIGKKTPGAFWGLWRKHKEIIKESGLRVLPLESDENGKMKYEVVFTSMSKDVDRKAVIECLKMKLKNLNEGDR